MISYLFISKLRVCDEVPINFSFVNVQGTSITEMEAAFMIMFDVVAALRKHNKWIYAQVELKEENFTFLLNYLGLFPQIPTAKESQAGFHSTSNYYLAL